MKVSKHILPIAVISLISITALSAKPVSALTSALQCSSAYGNTSFGCDIAIDKQVSVGSSSFTEAQTAAAAVPAQVGDTVTWKVTINNNSYNKRPIGELTVDDLLPSGVTYDSYSATTGVYTSSTGEWTFDLAGKVQPILTIVTTANATGLTENTATMAEYLPPCSHQQVPFSDFDGSNNTANAFINVPTPAPVTPPTTTTTTPSAPTAILGATTTSAKTPDTGFTVKDTNVNYTVLSYGLLTIALAGAGFKLRSLGKI